MSAAAGLTHVKWIQTAFEETRNQAIFKEWEDGTVNILTAAG